ncbi:CD99 molecule isoform X2 [Trichomycterus rosablanca]|uniref:CD99 molecule isoform X2 n=1 Tax=Trichomycterus rosablanca TaxID=2290929 RepID=UPI002F3562CD
MGSYLWILFFAVFAIAKAQDLDLFDALDDEVKPTPKPQPKPKAGGDEPKPKAGGDGSLDLADALGGDSPPQPEKPKQPAEEPSKPSGGGGDFSDSDLHELTGGGEYNPDAGKGGRAGGNSHDSTGDASDEPQASGGQMAGIISAVGVAILGAASSYFAYQKKKLCFKMQGGGGDPESGNNRSGTQSDPQALSNLMRSS